METISTYPSSFPNTSSGVIPAEVAAFYDAVLLERAVGNFVYQRWAQIRDISSKAGTDYIKFRRYSNLSAATTALTEGVTPAGSTINVTDIRAQVSQYGDFITVTDVIQYQSKDAVLMEFAGILGDQAADTYDQLCRDIIVAGTNVYYPSAAYTATSDVTSTDLITNTQIKKAVRLLATNKAKKLKSMLSPSDKYGTIPLQACFVGVVHENTTFDLKDLKGFKPIEKYSSHTELMEDEIGAVDEVRFVQTTNAKVLTGDGSGGIDVYATLIIAANAYGTTRVAGQAMKNIVKPLGSAGTADPLDQRATTGWKGTFVAKILNDDYLVRLEHAVSA